MSRYLPAAVAALGRDELALAKQEMSEKVTSLRSGIVFVAVGAVIGLVAVLCLVAAAVIGLAEYVGTWQSALIIGGLLGLAGAIVAFIAPMLWAS